MRQFPQIGARPVEDADAQFVVDACLLPHCRPYVHAPTIEQVRANVGVGGAQTYVIEADGKRAGIVRLIFMGEPIWLVELRLLVIAEPGKGYGGAAMEWLGNEAFGVLGAHRVFLEVAVSNARARALYERCGYVQEGVWRDGFRSDEGTYEDLIGYGMLDREHAARSGR